jgi:hypothetical protein
MAELADAADSKSADLRVLGVRLPLPAPKNPVCFEEAALSKVGFGWAGFPVEKPPTVRKMPSRIHLRFGHGTGMGQMLEN